MDVIRVYVRESNRKGFKEPLTPFWSENHDLFGRGPGRKVSSTTLHPKQKRVSWKPLRKRAIGGYYPSRVLLTRSRGKEGAREMKIE